jgi:hypothetical protein
MNKYYIEHKVLTLLVNAVQETKDVEPKSFEFSDVRFEHWDFNFREEWSSDRAWITYSIIEAESAIDAINIFRTKLAHILPRVSFLGQAYTAYITQPFLIRKIDNNEIAIFRFGKESKGNPLHFSNEQRTALDILEGKQNIPNEFFLYWQDATNTTGYSSKLLLMICAIESLVKKSGKQGRKDWDKLDKILGKRLRKKFFGEKGNSHKSLRNRLMHGEYLSEDDIKTNYMEILHKRTVKFFNKEVFKKGLMSEDVVRPQRNIFDNFVEWGPGFIKLPNKNFDLRKAIKYFEIEKLKDFMILEKKKVDKISATF